MQNNIYKTKDSLVIEIPLISKRNDVYDEDLDKDMDNIIGMIDKRNDTMGFSYVIDMSYKGKSDQFTDFFYKHFGNEDDFKELCKSLSIDIIYI